VRKDSAPPGRVPAFVEPMKAKLVNSTPSGDWIYEVKFDGYRASNELPRKIGKVILSFETIRPTWNLPLSVKTLVDLLSLMLELTL
jgi:hypothetical protein